MTDDGPIEYAHEWPHCRRSDRMELTMKRAGTWTPELLAVKLRWLDATVRMLEAQRRRTMTPEKRAIVVADIWKRHRETLAEAYHELHPMYPRKAGGA